jgi:hypothetical protein
MTLLSNSAPGQAVPSRQLQLFDGLFLEAVGEDDIAANCGIYRERVHKETRSGLKNTQ